MKTILYLILAILITGCKADLERLLGVHEWKTYQIKEGDHEAKGIHVASLTSDHLDFKATFDETCVYDLQSKDQNDINKLYGFSDCNCDHLKNSARFGWRWVAAKNKIEVLAYIHKDGKQILFDDDKNISMGYAELGQEGSYSIYIVGDSYNFNYNGNLKVFKYRGCSQQRTAHYMLYPFFGGDRAAPHQINIRIKE